MCHGVPSGIIISMNELQNLIVQAVEAMGEKQNYTETVLAKKIREITKYDGKKHAGIPLQELESALICVAEKSNGRFAIHVNQANMILIERKKSGETAPEENDSADSADAASVDESAVTLSPDARKRRLASEKSQVLFTNGDFSSINKDSAKRVHKKSQAKVHHQQRGERKSININSHFEDMDEY